jgi:catalase
MVFIWQVLPAFGMCSVRQRHIANCTRADPAYGAGVAKALGPGKPLGLKQPELID